MREKICCYFFSDQQQGIFYIHHSTDSIAHIMAFGTPVVEHWLEREIAQWVEYLSKNNKLVFVSCSHSSQCLITGVTKAVVCIILSVGGFI